MSPELCVRTKTHTNSEKRIEVVDVKYSHFLCVFPFNSVIFLKVIHKKVKTEEGLNCNRVLRLHKKPLNWIVPANETVKI